MVQPTFSIILPCYNEHDNISILIPRIIGGFSGDSIEIIFVDDGSTDGTIELVEKLSLQHPFIRIIKRPKLMGLGSALKAGFDAGKGRYFISFDCDLPIPIEDAKKVAEALRTDIYDLVLGSRYLRGSFYEAPNRDIFKKKMVSKCANLFFKFTNFINLTDFTFNCRGMKEGTWLKIRPESNNNFFLFEMVWRASRKKMKITEVPVRFYDRRLGSSKLNLKSEAKKYLAQFFSLRRKYLFKKLV